MREGASPSLKLPPMGKEGRFPPPLSPNPYHLSRATRRFAASDRVRRPRARPVSTDAPCRHSPVSPGCELMLPLTGPSGFPTPHGSPRALARPGWMPIQRQAIPSPPPLARHRGRARRTNPRKQPTLAETKPSATAARSSSSFRSPAPPAMLDSPASADRVAAGIGPASSNP